MAAMTLRDALLVYPRDWVRRTSRESDDPIKRCTRFLNDIVARSFNGHEYDWQPTYDDIVADDWDRI